MNATTSQGPFVFYPNREKEGCLEGRKWSWPLKDQIKYAVFLEYFQKYLVLTQTFQKNRWFFYRILSLFVQTKNPNQCRIFHKNNLTHYSSVSQLIQMYRHTIQAYDEWSENYRQNLHNISKSFCQQRSQLRRTMRQMREVLKIQNFDQAKEEKFSEDIISKERADDLKPTDINYAQETENYNLKFQNSKRQSISFLSNHPFYKPTKSQIYSNYSSHSQSTIQIVIQKQANVFQNL